jgi:hypothetical protein
VASPAFPEQSVSDTISCFYLESYSPKRTNRKPFSLLRDAGTLLRTDRVTGS